MEVKINSVHFTADEKLVEFVTKKVNKLDTFFDGIIKAEVTLKVAKPEAANNKVAELKLSIPATDYLFAKKQAELEKQLSERKTKPKKEKKKRKRKR